MNTNVEKLRNSRFFKNSILYTIGSMMTSLIGLFLLPVYTKYLNPAEYGIMSTILTLMGMIQLFLNLSLPGAVTRIYYDFSNNSDEQKKYLGSIFIFILIFSTIISTILLLSHEIIGGLLFNNIPIFPYYFYLIILSWISSLIEFPMALLRAKEMARTYAIINILKAMAIMIVTLYLLVIKGLGLNSIFISQIIITFIFVLIIFVMERSSFKLILDFSHLRRSLDFSLPLLPHVASAWIISSSDRVILEKLVDMNDLGIYALASQVTYVLNTFYSSVNNAFLPRYIILRQERKEQKANRLLKILKLVVIVFGILSIPVAVYGLKLFISSEYLEVLSIVPILLLGKIMTGLYLVPVAKLYYSRKTTAIAKSSSIAAFVNIAVSIIAIPRIGIYGAVCSTIISELFRYVFIYISSKKIE